MIVEPNGRKLHILVIEDNSADVELLRWALESAGIDCDLSVIDDGGEALALVRNRGKYLHSPPPDLAILDLNLPKYDGIEILEAMRGNLAFAGVPVAVLSSSSSPREMAKMEAFGIDRFLTKPLDLDEYLEIGLIVKGLLEQSRAGGLAGRK